MNANVALRLCIGAPANFNVQIADRWHDANSYTLFKEFWWSPSRIMVDLNGGMAQDQTQVDFELPHDKMSTRTV